MFSSKKTLSSTKMYRVSINGIVRSNQPYIEWALSGFFVSHGLGAKILEIDVGVYKVVIHGFRHQFPLPLTRIKNLLWERFGSTFEWGEMTEVKFSDTLYDVEILPSLSKMKKYSTQFKSMEEFYGALASVGLDEENVGIIRKVFEARKIRFTLLASLTDEKLKDYGLTQIGLREIVLTVIGK